MRSGVFRGAERLSWPDDTFARQEPAGSTPMLPLFGMLLLVLALFDLACIAVGESLTGVVWSPAVFFVLGLLFCILEAPRDDGRFF